MVEYWVQYRGSILGFNIGFNIRINIGYWVSILLHSILVRLLASIFGFNIGFQYLVSILGSIFVFNADYPGGGGQENGYFVSFCYKYFCKTSPPQPFIKKRLRIYDIGPRLPLSYP